MVLGILAEQVNYSSPQEFFLAIEPLSLRMVISERLRKFHR